METKSLEGEIKLLIESLRETPYHNAFKSINDFLVYLKERGFTRETVYETFKIVLPIEFFHSLPEPLYDAICDNLDFLTFFCHKRNYIWLPEED